MSAQHLHERDPRAADPPLWGVVPPPHPAGGSGGSAPGEAARFSAGLLPVDRLEAAPVAPVPRGSAPEPLDWRPPPRFRDRVLSAVGAPVVVGVVCFAAAVATIIVTALLQPHTHEPARTDPPPAGASAEASSVGAPPSAGEQVAGAREPAVGTATVLVHVVGKVRSPGVVELPQGSRVEDAIEAAGGATSRAALAKLNLARALVDGEQVVVPKKGAANSPRSAAAPAGGDGSAGAIDLNTADAATLEELPRIGPALAQRIVDWRDAYGGFTTVEQLMDVPGIGAKTLEGFRARVSV